MENNEISTYDIERLNYLYSKSNSVNGLTYEEEEEQGLLRQKFMNYFNEKVKY